ncbi:MAG: glycine cleavage system aminomethyltransferase GcvT [Aigarchaeota archaeon]|nr:glycine cleavage system aminomethyltransferase GcvT [Aigarchaeota archaeon]MDW8092406.1 glycine cleavage system aminomethyltransferase GcvT [Nitrososphaerota archaeon]
MRAGVLISIHESHASVLGEFSGWRVPIVYLGTKAEHASVRNSCGLFDVSHMTRLVIEGERAADELSKLLTVDTRVMKVNRMKYSLILNERGGIIDDVTVSRLGPHRYLLVSNAVTRDRVIDWIGSNVIIDDLTHDSLMLAVQGPSSPNVIREVLGVKTDSMRWFQLNLSEYRGCECVVSRSGYTGEDGFEVILIKPAIDAATGLWKSFVERGATPCGLAVRDVLRLEAGYPLYGVDVDESMNPYEARLDSALEMDRHDFIGRGALIGEKRIRVTLVGLMMSESGIPRRGMGVYRGEDKIGVVTSGCLSYSLQRGIALSHVSPDEVGDGRLVSIDYRGRRRSASIKLTPFVERRMPR